MTKKPLPSEITKEFFRRYRQKRFFKNEIIIDPDAPPKEVFFIVGGKVKKYGYNYKGEEIVVTVFRPGSFIPVTASSGQNIKDRFYYAAETDVLVKVAPAQDVIKMLNDNPDVMMALVHRLNRALNEFLDRTFSLMTGNALSRVAYEIYIEAKRFGELNDHGIKIDLSERGIAARTGLSRETVNREIRKIKDIHAVKVERGHIVVTDLTKLETKLYKKLL